MKSKVIREKAYFVSKLEELLTADERSWVSNLHYEVRCTGDDGIEEAIHIIYRGGHRKRVCVTCCSLGSIARNIIREVYGDEIQAE